MKSNLKTKILPERSQGHLRATFRRRRSSVSKAFFREKHQCDPHFTEVETEAGVGAETGTRQPAPDATLSGWSSASRGQGLGGRALRDSGLGARWPCCEQGREPFQTHRAVGWLPRNPGHGDSVLMVVGTEFQENPRGLFYLGRKKRKHRNGF